MGLPQRAQIQKTVLKSQGPQGKCGQKLSHMKYF